MKKKRTKSYKKKKKLPVSIYFISAVLGFFLLSFFYLWERGKVREMLIAEQKLRETEQKLIEENRKLELDIANLCSLENLRKTIDEPGFGFPQPDRMRHLSWYEEKRDDRDMWERASELVMDLLKDGLDVNKQSRADSPSD